MTGTDKLLNFIDSGSETPAKLVKIDLRDVEAEIYGGRIVDYQVGDSDTEICFMIQGRTQLFLLSVETGKIKRLE